MLNNKYIKLYFTTLNLIVNILIFVLKTEQIRYLALKFLVSLSCFIFNGY